MNHWRQSCRVLSGRAPSHAQQDHIGATAAMKLLLSLFAALAGIPNAHAVNKCTDSAGKVSYQEGPCPKGNEAATVRIQAAPPTDPNENVYNAAAARGRVMTGMSAAQVRRSWGSPTKINRSTGSYGVHEQWVYERGGIGRSQYVYLQNGVVSSIQSPAD